MNQFLIALLVLLGCLGVCVGFKYLRTKKLISEQDLDLIIIAFGLSRNIALQMGLKNEPKIKQISEIVMDSLEYCKKTYGEACLYEDTIIYISVMCEKNGITLNEQQKSIVNQLIQIALNTGFI